MGCGRLRNVVPFSPGATDLRQDRLKLFVAVPGGVSASHAVQSRWAGSESSTDGSHITWAAWRDERLQ